MFFLTGWADWFGEVSPLCLVWLDFSAFEEDVCKLLGLLKRRAIWDFQQKPGRLDSVSVSTVKA